VRHKVGIEDEFPAGLIKVTEIAGRSIGIVNTGQTLYAVLNVCPHALAPVCEGRLTGTLLPSRPGEAEWGLEGRILRCPWHGYEYDLADGGRTVFTSFKARVRMFPVVVEDGEVYVEIPDRSSRQAEAGGDAEPGAPRPESRVPAHS
jgi:nitrite reductase/ring-hydroxylating ferredoxin subunit